METHFILPSHIRIYLPDGLIFWIFFRQIPAYFYPDEVSQPAMFRDTYINSTDFELDEFFLNEFGCYQK